MPIISVSRLNSVSGTNLMHVKLILRIAEMVVMVLSTNENL